MSWAMRTNNLYVFCRSESSHYWNVGEEKGSKQTFLSDWMKRKYPLLVICRSPMSKCAQTLLVEVGLGDEIRSALRSSTFLLLQSELNGPWIGVPNRLEIISMKRNMDCRPDLSLDKTAWTRCWKRTVYNQSWQRSIWFDCNRNDHKVHCTTP